MNRFKYYPISRLRKISACVVVIFFQIYSLGAYAQGGSVKGRVYDAVNNEPLPFVNVIVAGTTTGSITDLDGNFIITGLNPGFIRLSVSFVGYKQTLSDEIQISNAKTAYIEIPLEQSEEKIEEVVVKASPFKRTKESPLSLRSIGLAEIESNPGSNRDISKVIQSFPGVGSTPLFRNDIIIRGGGPNESVFYLDGVEVPNINHFATQGASGGAVGIINADFISSVNYYSGAFPTNRGDALSGVFEFTQKDGNKEETKYRTVVGASEISLTADGPIGKKTSFIFSARQSYLQFLFSVLQLPFLPNFNDFQLKTRTKIDEKNEITVIGLGAIDRFKLNLDIEDPTEDQEYILSYLPVNEQWSYAIGTVYKHFRKNSYQTIVLSRNMLNNTSYKYPDNDATKSKILDYESQEIENKLRIENTSRFSGYKLNFGVNGEYAKYLNDTYQKLFVNSQLQIIDYDSFLEMYKWGVFSQLSKGYFNDRLRLSLGIRMDAINYSEHTKNIFNQFSPRFSASYLLNDKLSVNFNAGRYHQLPAYTTLGYRNREGDLVNKENNLKYISVDHLIAGVEFRPADNSTIVLEGFYKGYGNYPFSIRDSISIANKGGDYGVIGDEEVVSTGEGRAYGAELMTRLRLDKLNFLFSYTYVRSEFKDKNGDYIPSSWDSRHILTLTAQRKFKNNWMAGVKWRYLGGLPYTPYNLELSSNIQAWNTQGRPFLDYNRLNALRLGAFHQLDIRIDRQFFFKRWSLMFYLDIQNLYNFKAEQPDYVIREQDENGGYKTTDNGTDYVLKRIENASGTVLPTIGIMVEF